jgi:hypothetical protein
MTGAGIGLSLRRLRPPTLRRSGHGASLAAILYRCPNTGLSVQGWFADDASADEGETYEAVTCTACRQVHFVNRVNGKVLSGDED